MPVRELGIESLLDLARAPLRPFYESWAASGALAGLTTARELARWLVLPASGALLTAGMGWLAGAVGAWRKEGVGERACAELREALVPMLRLAWKEERGPIRAAPALIGAFKELLDWTAAGGTAAALELEDEVRRTM